MTPGAREPFVVHCGRCSHEWAPCFTPVPTTVFAKVAARPCPACGSRQVLVGPQPRPTAEGDVDAWLHHGDTGTSSLTIWHVLTGRPMPGHFGPGVPHDPADFGRCLRLLKVMPTWRARLPEVAARYPKWAPLVEAWDELTQLYEEERPTGQARRLYRRMCELRGV